MVLGLLNTAYPVLLALLGFSFLVGFHELGHFLFCKLFGVHTPSFSIGFGPRLFQKKFGGTTFALSAIPFGGYVEIAGMSEPGQGHQEHATKRGTGSFPALPYYKKMLIISGGILFNLIFAYVALVFIFLAGGTKTPLLYPLNATTSIAVVEPGSPAEAAGLSAGDTIRGISAGSDQVEEASTGYFPIDLLKFISSHPNQEATLRVETKAGETLIGCTIKKRSESDTRGYLGLSFTDKQLESQGLVASLMLAARQVNFWVISVADSLKGLVSRRSLDGVGGPLMIISQMIKGAERGLMVLLTFLAFISVNLAVLNLLPLPVFDGGQALFYTLEAILGRPISEAVKGKIYTGTAFAVIILMAYISLKDVWTLVHSYLVR